MTGSHDSSLVEITSS